jgi:hypothetical protein
MYDPDAFGGSRVHWAVTDINDNDVNNGYNLLRYKGPAPPPKTGKHRYIFELYEKPINETGILEERSISIKKVRKNSPNTTYPCLCIFLHYTTILIIKRLTCSCTLECLLGLYFLAHSPSV